MEKCMLLYLWESTHGSFNFDAEYAHVHAHTQIRSNQNAHEKKMAK